MCIVDEELEEATNDKHTQDTQPETLTDSATPENHEPRTAKPDERVNKLKLHKRYKVVSLNVSTEEEDTRTGTITNISKKYGEFWMKPDSYEGLQQSEGLVLIPTSGWELVSIEQIL